MHPDQVASELAETYRKNQKSAQKAIGRYQGWVLIDSKFGKENVEPNYSKIKEVCAELGYQLIRWSSLSQDEDDKDEFGINLYGSF